VSAPLDTVVAAGAGRAGAGRVAWWWSRSSREAANGRSGPGGLQHLPRLTFWPVGRLQVGTVHLAQVRLLVSSVAPATTGGDLVKFLDVHVEQLAEACSAPVS